MSTSVNNWSSGFLNNVDSIVDTIVGMKKLKLQNDVTRETNEAKINSENRNADLSNTTAQQRIEAETERTSATNAANVSMNAAKIESDQKVNQAKLDNELAKLKATLDNEMKLHQMDNDTKLAVQRSNNETSLAISKDANRTKVATGIVSTMAGGATAAVAGSIVRGVWKRKSFRENNEFSYRMQQEKFRHEEEMQRQKFDHDEKMEERKQRNKDKTSPSNFTGMRDTYPIRDAVNAKSRTKDTNIRLAGPEFTGVTSVGSTKWEEIKSSLHKSLQGGVVSIGALLTLAKGVMI